MSESEESEASPRRATGLKIPRRRTIPRTAAKRKSYIESDEELNSDSDDYIVKPQAKSRAKKRTAPVAKKERAADRRRKRARTDESSDENEEEKSGVDSKQRKTKPTCPHCKKTFAIKQGLGYHLANFVCRAKLKASDSIETKRKPKTKKPKTTRGAENKRTCPKCKRVFTSIHGLDYHLRTFNQQQAYINIVFLTLLIEKIFLY
jgi:hypothetical protein